MNKSKRRVVIAGNWKMNMTPAKTASFIAELAPMVADNSECDIVLCVPAIDIPAAVLAAKGTNIKIGAENIHFAKSGAYTGEISGEMLTEAGVEYVIIGHSERRQYFNETDMTVNMRLRAALDAGLKAIVCVGELLSERKSGITEYVLGFQTTAALYGIPAEMMKNVIIAYEPVWAIGTGEVATPEQADEGNGIVRAAVERLYGKDVADSVTVQYGGSMNAKNAKGLLEMENIDGGLIGGASLKCPDFTAITEAAK